MQPPLPPRNTCMLPTLLSFQATPVMSCLQDDADDPSMSIMAVEDYVAFIHACSLGLGLGIYVGVVTV